MTILAAIVSAAIIVFDYWMFRGKSKTSKLYLAVSLILPAVIVSAWMYNIFLR